MTIKLKTKIPGPNSQALMTRRLASVPRGPFHASPIFVKRARGAWLEDVDGNQILDFAAGIGVVNVGHCAEAVTTALSTQVNELLHAGFNVTPYESYIELCEKLNALTPGAHAKKTFLANSGTEAVENAIKLARAYTGRQAILAFDHAFHGRTYMAMTLTSKAKPYKAGFAPFAPEVYRAPFPYAYRWPTTDDPKKVAQECMSALRNVVEAQIGANHCAAVIIEPVLGEGGFVPASKDFMTELRAYTQQHGILLICDEIQTGFGRTGTLFATEHFDVVPDLMTLAKGLGGGLPIAAVTGRADVMDAASEGGIGGTYGGNPVACAAALAVIETFTKTDLLKRTQNLTNILRETLQGWQERYGIVGDARGLGPMQALEFVTDKTSKTPHPTAAKAIAKYCYEHGVVVMTAGTAGNVLRFLMPLVIDERDLMAGLAVVEDGLKQLS